MSANLDWGAVPRANIVQWNRCRMVVGDCEPAKGHLGKGLPLRTARHEVVFVLVSGPWWWRMEDTTIDSLMDLVTLAAGR